MPIFRPASDDITHQFLDGEVVAIDFKQGNYYNLRGAAGVAFDALMQGIPSEKLSSLFSNVPDDASLRLEQLCAKWVEIGLLAPSSDSPSTAPAAAPQPWAEPTFEVYTDMQQLLLADPIHDVGDGSWPREVAPRS